MPKGRTPGATLMGGGQKADRRVPVHMGPSAGAVAMGGEALSTAAGRAGVAGFNATQRGHYNETVMSVPDVTKGAPGPQALATGLDAGGAPRGRRGGGFKGFLDG